MFKNPGKIIKDYVVFLFFLLVFAVGIIGVLYMMSDSFLHGLIVIVIGVLSAYILCLFIYAFGDLVESNRKMKENTDEILDILDTFVYESEE